LRPNQKITWKGGTVKRGDNNSPTVQTKVLKTDVRVPEPIRVTDHGDIKEIAWKENKLVFEDDSLADIAVLLERWYGVRIEFDDDSIRSYRFTGVFEKEDLQALLDFLKESKSFNYRINNGQIQTVLLSR